MDYKIDFDLSPNQAAFVDGYIDAIYFADTGGDCEIDPHAEMSGDAMCRSVIECLAFLYRVECYLDTDAVGESFYQAGADFWYTRNGHGTGYWDTTTADGYGPYTDILTRHAESFGVCEIFQNDDHQLDM